MIKCVYYENYDLHEAIRRRDSTMFIQEKEQWKRICMMNIIRKKMIEIEPICVMWNKLLTCFMNWNNVIEYDENGHFLSMPYFIFMETLIKEPLKMYMSEFMDSLITLKWTWWDYEKECNSWTCMPVPCKLECHAMMNENWGYWMKNLKYVC